MKKTQVNYTIDWIAFVLLGALVTTGVILHFRLPPGSGGASLSGLTRHQWGDVHFWSAALLSAIAIVHLLLHANWIAVVTAGPRGGGGRTMRKVGAIAGVAVVLAAIVAASLWPTVRGRRGEHASVRASEVGVDQLEGRTVTRGLEELR